MVNKNNVMMYNIHQEIRSLKIQVLKPIQGKRRNTYLHSHSIMFHDISVNYEAQYGIDAELYVINTQLI